MTKPTGLEGHTRDFVVIKIPHEFVTLHQEAFPELKEKMRYNPSATNIYAAFLTMLPLTASDNLSPS